MILNGSTIKLYVSMIKKKTLTSLILNESTFFYGVNIKPIKSLPQSIMNAFHDLWLINCSLFSCGTNNWLNVSQNHINFFKSTDHWYLVYSLYMDVCVCEIPDYSLIHSINPIIHIPHLNSWDYTAELCQTVHIFENGLRFLKCTM